MASHCSGIFFIMSSISKYEPSLGEYYSNQKKVTDDFLSIYLKEDLGHSVNIRVIKAARISSSTTFLFNYFKSPTLKDTIYQTLKYCTGWTKAVLEHLQKSDSVADAPRPNNKYKYPFDNFEKVTLIIDDAFSIYKEIGAPKPIELFPKEIIEASRDDISLSFQVDSKWNHCKIMGFAAKSQKFNSCVVLLGQNDNRIEKYLNKYDHTDFSESNTRPPVFIYQDICSEFGQGKAGSVKSADCIIRLLSLL